MKNIGLIVKCNILIVLLSLSTLNTMTLYAQVDLGLCPDGFNQGVVTTGFVECYRETSRTTREQAEFLRLQREAICEAHPNSEVTSSEIFGTSSGNFYAMITCAVTRSIPPGTVLCPDNTEEVYRAFDTLICQDFGSASQNLAEAQAEMSAQVDACINSGGQVVNTEMSEEEFDGVMFYTSSVACSYATAAVDNIECPFGFEETDRDENSIECVAEDRSHETLEEAEAASTFNQSICTDTTAGLGSVGPETMTGITSSDNFFSFVVCNIGVAQYGEFEDSSVIRACDATCTEEVEQSRLCLNGGVIGGPGCIEPSTQSIERRCHTGTAAGGLCQLTTPMTDVNPLLLLNDDD